MFSARILLTFLEDKLDVTKYAWQEINRILSQHYYAAGMPG